MAIESTTNCPPKEPLTCEPEPLVCEAPPAGPPPTQSPATQSDEICVERAKMDGAGGSGNHVELCRRDADLTGKSIHHAKHHWLKTSTREAGMGAEGKGVPGHDSVPDRPLVRTTVNDHSGESKLPDAECTPVADVNEQCLNEQLELGQYTGRWWLNNNCQTWAKKALDACREPLEAGTDYEQWKQSKDIP